jgi:hypothetical protein
MLLSTARADEEEEEEEEEEEAGVPALKPQGAECIPCSKASTTYQPRKSLYRKNRQQLAATEKKMKKEDENPTESIDDDLE